MKIIGVTGGKGGTGKTTVAVALARELSKNHKVLLVDADVDCPNSHLLLGIKRKFYSKVEQRIPKWDLAKCNKSGKCGAVCKTSAIVAIKDKYPIFIPTQCNGCGACLLACPEGAISWSKKEVGTIYRGTTGNIDLLSGELKTNEPVSELVVNLLNKIIEKEKDKYGYIIVDTAAGTHCPVIKALQICGSVLAIAEPTPLGKHDLELILKLLKKIKQRAGIVLNRCDIGDEKLIKKLAKEYDTKIIAQIPYSKKIVKQYSRGEPIRIKNIKDIIRQIL